MSGVRIFTCPRPLARQAVERWHYSRTLPAAGLDLYGVEENGRFVGVVAFGMGANYRLAASFGMAQAEVRELARVALASERTTPTTAIVTACLRRLRRERPSVRLVVSYADTKQGHHGGVYQAGSWVYLGVAVPGRTVHLLGQQLHNRSVWQRYGTTRLAWLRQHVDPDVTVTVDPPKHKYALGFDGQIRRRLRRLAKPYPCAVKESTATRPASNREGQVRSLADRSNCLVRVVRPSS